MKIIPERVMILGGSGLVGFQIARQIARDLQPKTIFLVALHQESMRTAMQRLRKEFPKVTFDGTWGNLFLRASWREKKRGELFRNPRQVADLINDIYAETAAASARNLLAEVIRKQKPDVIVDALPTAPKLVLQDNTTRILEISRELMTLQADEKARGRYMISREMVEKIEAMIVHLAIPQLTRHVQTLNEGMRSAGTRLYLKVGTTGSGGMGLNIPYTNSEDRPSNRLLAKTAIGFAHTGLLFVMARTPGAPIIKEIKPAALIGSRQIEYRTVEQDNKPLSLYHAKKTQLGQSLSLQPDVGYARKGELSMVGVHTGSTGFLALSEFEAITTMFQMEFITPEEIAQIVVLEIRGVNTGHDIIAALDSAVIDPSYRAGLLRRPILDEMRRLENETQTHSVAIGQLGPPELTKLLYEAWLLKAKYRRLVNVLNHEPEELSHGMEQYILHHPIRHTIISVGIPILMADGLTLLRGPFIKIPEYRGEKEMPVTPTAISMWADKGWIDLRPANMAKWQKRLRQMAESCKDFFSQDSRDLGRGPCPAGPIEIGDVVGWLFNNDPAIAGFRLKSS
jgi:hypothetical protein